MAFFIRRLLAAPLILINFVLYLAVAAIAGWALNLAINEGWEAVSYNPATFYFVMLALVAGVVGLASALSGAHHLKSWRTDTLAGSTAGGSIAWLLTLLALGLASKEISLGGDMYFQMKILEALVIIVAATQLLYLLAVGAGAFRGEYIVRTRDAFETPAPPPVVSKE